MRSTAILVTLLVCPTLSAAQVRDQPRPPVRDNAAPLTGSASIAGTIVADTEPARPLRRAIVTVNSTDRTIGRTTVTDDNGRFAVTGLPAGRYNIAATKAGWVTAAYGAKTPDPSGGAPLTLTDGQRATLSLRLLRGAVITGVIVDDTGQSPASTFVSAERYMQFGGERRLVPAGSTRGADARGQYRIYGLAPGDYYILVSPGFVGPFRGGSDLHLTSDVDVQEALNAIKSAPGSQIADVPQRSVTPAPVFYPGVHNVSQATPVTVRAGEERSGVDFVVPYVASVHVEGAVTGLDGAPANNTVVTLVNTDLDTLSFGFDSVRSSRTDATGRFSFLGIRPGAYAVNARSASPAGWAQADVDVQGDDVRGLSLAMQSAFTVSGTVRFEGTTTAPPLTNVRVSLASEPGAMVITSNTSGNATADGRFTITGVTPGRYRLTAYLPAPRPTWMLRTSTLGGQEALDTFIDVRQDVVDASVVFTDQLAELSGHAAPNSTVILFSTNQARWSQQSGRLRMTRAATDGGYTFTTVTPGEYFIIAVDDLQPGQWSDPVYLQGLTTSSTKITIAEGEKKTLDIRAGGGI